MKHGASLLYSFTLLVGDFLALVGAFGLAYIVRVKLDDRPLLEPITAEGYIGVVAVLLIFWLMIFGLLGLYKNQVYENRFKEFAFLFVGSFIGILFLIGSEYVLNRAIFPARLVTVYGFMFAFLLTLLFRTVLRSVRRSLFQKGVGVSNVLLIGTTDVTGELAHMLSHKHLGFKVIGIVGDRRNKYPHVDKSLQYKDFAEASKKIKTSDIHSIVQTELFTNERINDEILAFAQEHHIAYRLVPGNNRLFIGKIDVTLFNNIPTIAVHQTALTGWGRIVKRAFDIFVSSILILLFSPILILMYLLIKITDYGPALYKEKRLSRFNNQFNIYKFRSFRIKTNGMPVDKAYEMLGEKELAKKYRDGDDSIPIDPLLHPLGKFLRATSIDELPQLFNVIKGELSLVGPRPLVPRELDSFSKKNIILSVKPGITGLAAISGRRNIPFEERRKLDMYYAQNWSFWLDITILIKTAAVVINRVVSGKAD